MLNPPFSLSRLPVQPRTDRPFNYLAHLPQRQLAFESTRSRTLRLIPACRAPRLNRQSIIITRFGEGGQLALLLSRRAGSPTCLRFAGKGLDQGLDKEMVSPDHRFIHSELLMIMVDAVQKDSFPSGPA